MNSITTKLIAVPLAGSRIIYAANTIETLFVVSEAKQSGACQ